MDYAKILGAGPAGLSAAINLASAGYSVNVFEKNQEIGSVVKRNLQGLENWSDKQDVVKEFKKMRIKPNFDCEPFKNLRITNRFFWEKFASNNYSFMLNRIHNAEDPIKYLHSFHNFNLVQRLIYPLAFFYMKHRYPNLKL